MSTSNDQRGYRLDCIDLLRGLVIVIMALDHVRDFFMVAGPDPTSDDATPALFATRWITHFCAPVFVLLAGISAGLMVARGVFELPANRRNALLFRSGIILTAIFVALRALDIYGDPNHWRHHEGGVVATAIDFLNTTKYPPSLSFLLMTLGPAAIFCSCADRVTGWIKEALVTFGRVPFAFYVSHLFLIHSLSIVLGVVQGFHAGSI